MGGSETPKKDRLSGLKKYFANNPNKREVIFYIIFTFLAFVCDLLTRLVVDIALVDMDQIVKIWIFPPQAQGTLIAFLMANIVAKVVGFILNRKKTFRANNNRWFSIITYVIMSVSFIIIETIIGAPIQNGLYRAMGGAYKGAALTTASAIDAGLYQFCGTLSQIIYGICDFVAAFFLEKHIIMKRKD